MQERELEPQGPAAEAADQFLARVRARLIVSSLLGGAAFAAAANELVRWSSAAAVVYLGWKVPVFGFLGLLVLAVLVLPALRRWTPATAAAHADARLRLQDRLGSLVDFRGRTDVPESIRRAQARETARALAGATPATAAPIAAWRKAGPVLLAGCMLYQFFLPTRWSSRSPLVTVVVPVWRLAPSGEEATAPRGGEERQAAEGKRKADGGAASPPAADGEEHGRAPGAADPGEMRGTTDAETKLANGDSSKSGERTRREPRNLPKDPREPERIESERVGERLARVVDPLYSPGGGPTPIPLSAGVATFHLLPQAGASGTGGGPGETVTPEPVRVDFDLILAPYRPIVKAYFDQLARAAVPAGGALSP